MPRRTSITSGLALTALVVLAGCNDSRPLTEPAADGPAFSHSGAEAPELRVLKFKRAREAEESASRVIGPDGGQISVSGVTLTVPAGALDEDVEISVTVPDGGFVETEFAPHGLEFNEPVTVEIDFGNALPEHASSIAVANAVAQKVQDGLQAVYFDGELGVDARALDIFGVDVNGTLATFQTGHFSGYCLATG